MARTLVARTTLRCWLRAETALHPGGLADLPEADDAVACDLAGRPVVRGTALAGVLAATLDLDSRDAWGSTERASRLWVEDALVGAAPATADFPPPGDGWWRAPRLEHRDGVGIDRTTGAAAARILYTREVVAAGAVLAVQISIDSVAPSDVAADAQLLADVLGAFRRGITLGARTSRGLGRLRLAGTPRVERVRYTGADTFLDTLVAPEVVSLPEPEPVAEPAVVEVEWRPRRSVVVASDLTCDLVDILPMVTADPQSPEEYVRLVLPGAGIAGALRSRAELIVRTVRGDDPPDGFDRQLSQYEIITALFGAARGGEASGAGRSAVSVQDCLSTNAIARAVWDGTLLGDLSDDKRERIKRRRVLAGHGLHIVDRVASDRWTGGAAKGRLYSRLEPVSFEYERLRLEVRLDRIPERVRDAAAMLLLLTVRDLRDGWVTLGGGSTQGSGEVEVERVSVRGLLGLDQTLDGRWWTDELPRLPAAQAWRDWCDGSPGEETR